MPDTAYMNGDQLNFFTLLQNLKVKLKPISKKCAPNYKMKHTPWMKATKPHLRKRDLNLRIIDRGQVLKN